MTSGCAAWAPSSSLPPLYDTWIRDLLGGGIPEESDATCEQCAMCAGEEPQYAGLRYFRPDTKCCTYVPTLPNFLVGRILADDDPAHESGRRTLEARLAARVAVTPLEVGLSPVLAVLYKRGGSTIFGRSRSLRCPHYLADEDGRCGIWSHRNGVCATWFCKHVRGAVGRRFWEALDELLFAVERSLARWCLLQLDVEIEALQRLFPTGADRGRAEDLTPREADAEVDEPTYRGLWGSWSGREREFFEEASRLVCPMAWSDVGAVSGPDVQLHARLVRDAYEELIAEQVPQRLVPGPVEVISAETDRIVVVAKGEAEPLALPRDLFGALLDFDGRPTADTLKRIERKRRLQIEMPLVGRLADFRILVPAPFPTSNAASGRVPGEAPGRLRPRRKSP